MNKYVIFLYDKPTGWLIQFFEVEAPTKHRAIKILKSEYSIDKTYIIRCFKKED